MTRRAMAAPLRLRPELLVEAPERAAISALEAVLDIAFVVMLTANPELDDLEAIDRNRNQPFFPRIEASHRILQRGRALAIALENYVRVLDRERERALERERHAVSADEDIF